MLSFLCVKRGIHSCRSNNCQDIKKQGYKPLDPDKNGLVTLPIRCWFISSTRNYRFVLPILLSAAHLVISSGRLSVERTAWSVYF